MRKQSISFPLKRISRIAIMAALCVVLRYAFAGLPNVQPITAIFLIASLVFSLCDAMLIMTLTMLVSSFLMLFGPWVFWQIITFSIILIVWRYIFYPLSILITRPFKKGDVILQAIFAGSMGIVYGVVIDSFYAYIYNMPWWTYVMAGANYNFAHALSTLIFYPLILPILRRFSSEKVI